LNTIWNDEEFCSGTVAPIFERAAKDQGFHLILKGWEPKHNKLIFICKRGTYYREKNGSYYLAKKEGESSIGQCLQQEYSKRVATTSRAIKGQNSACRFGFSVYWHPDVKRWFLPKEQAGCKHHSGHLKVPPHLVNLPIKALPPDEIQLAKDGTHEFMKTSMLEALIHRRNDVTISRDRLKYYQQCKKDIANNPIIERVSTGNPEMDGDLPQPRTPADKLLAALDSDQDVSYIALYGNYDSHLLTIRQKRKVRETHSVDEFGTSEDLLNDPTDSAKQTAEQIRGDLLVSGTGMILLGVTWTENTTLKRFSLFPEVTAVDIMEKTNSEGRPMMTCTGMDSNNELFPYMWAFMPSQAIWAFKWFFLHAYPAMTGPQVLPDIHLFLADGDYKLYKAIDKNSGTEHALFPKATCRSCSWHYCN
jgi:hypothetical protein